ncbi:hypothetical protein Cni_G24958 [Canna indica]|uniref:Uncharacterized protein n=1 Tax=Canna indica TaxID=4628 RepID=A0AAQ3QKM1_9LILI|nr:hypothetical protein Cni_G24958 [Canna indica]
MPEHTISPFLLIKLSLAVKMKNKAAIIIKQVATALAAMIRSKSMALKNKAITMRARFIIFKLLRNKKLMLSAVSSKVHSLVTQKKATVLLKAAEAAVDERIYEEEEDDDDLYPDLRHTLFDLQLDDDDGEEEEELVNAGSVIEWVKSSREEGEEFNLEDEIDHVADVFIRRFHRQMRLEKQELERSV